MTNPWSLHDLMPLCPVPTCPRYNTRHMLTHQEEIAKQILTGNENYIYWQGGVGSAKTSLYGALSAALSITIPNSRGILFRKDLALNYETLWRFFKESIKAACELGIITANYNKLWSVKKAGEYTYCNLPNGSIIRCGQTKNWSEYMGPTYDFIVISDAMENATAEIFRGEGTVGGLQSRLRGAASSYYQLPNGTTKDMRRFLIESNPPPRINWLHEVFGKEPGVRNLPGINVTYRHIQTTSVQNDHLPPTYIQEIASQHNREDIKRILEGKTVPYYGGVRVIESFHTEIHVNKFDYDPTLPLFIGIDGGYQHPAVTFSQIRRCSYEKEHYITLSEITNLFNITTWELVEHNKQDLLGILPHLALFYPSHFDYNAYTSIRNHLLNNETIDFSILEQHFNKIRFCIDRAGDAKSGKNKDAKSDRLILLTEYGIRCKVKQGIGVDKSLDRVRELHKELCICNVPRRLVDQKCALLIDAYGGGYRYAKKRDGSHSDKPVEDHLYEDICDADRYSLENFYFSPWVEPAQPKLIINLVQDQYLWMDSSCYECGERFNTKAELETHKEREHVRY